MERQEIIKRQLAALITVLLVFLDIKIKIWLTFFFIVKWYEIKLWKDILFSKSALYKMYTVPRAMRQKRQTKMTQQIWMYLLKLKCKYNIKVLCICIGHQNKLINILVSFDYYWSLALSVLHM